MDGRVGYQTIPIFQMQELRPQSLSPVLAPPQGSDMVKSASSEVGWVRIHFLALVWFPAMVVTLSVIPSDGGAGNTVLEEDVIAEAAAALEQSALFGRT